MKRMLTVVVVSLILCVTAQSQENSDQLAKLGDTLRSRISREMPGWRYRSIDPIEGSRGVVIQLWELGDISVKVAIAQYPSEEKAAEAFKTFTSQMRSEEEATRASRGNAFRRIKEESLTLGDEGVVWDIRGAEAVSIRTGKFRVDVSIARPEQSNDVHFSRVFAAHAAAVLQFQ